jgi:membrane protein required for colicin V production
MLIDIIFVVLMILAIVKGFRRGLIVAVFSFIAVVVGLAAAIKLSTVAAHYLGQSVKVSDKWLPVIAFAGVFIIVAFLVRLGARLIEKTFQLAMLGFVNRLGGIVLYVILYTIIYSILLFYVSQIHILQPGTLERSATYPYIQSWGPKVIDSLGKLIPIFRDMFTVLEDFFANLFRKMQ